MMPYHNHSDTELLALLILGDAQAFEVIYRRYVSNLYRYARKNISVKEDCEEMVHDIFESLWLRRRELGHVTALNAYLFKMIRYKIIRYFQHNSVKKRYAEHYALFEALYENSSDNDRDQQSMERMIAKGLANLPERCQMAVKLRLTENLSNADIARRMNIKKSTVENYIVAALSHLRSLSSQLKKVG
jgi:RNA polymerase sigma-70 factor (ECF subfamily)